VLCLNPLSDRFHPLAAEPPPVVQNHIARVL
jgi:hypothetical protein